MGAPVLKFGSFSLPAVAGLDISQDYEQFGGESVFRAADGTGYKQETWTRLRVTTRGSGWIPSALQSLNTSAQMTVACIVPRLLPADGSRQATLPVARRGDAGHVPYGIAILADGTAQRCDAALAGDVATAAVVSGATAYFIGYFPQITAWIFRPTLSGSPSDAVHNWEIVAEEA